MRDKKTKWEQLKDVTGRQSGAFDVQYRFERSRHKKLPFVRTCCTDVSNIWNILTRHYKLFISKNNNDNS